MFINVIDIRSLTSNLIRFSPLSHSADGERDDLHEKRSEQTNVWGNVLLSARKKKKNVTFDDNERDDSRDFDFVNSFNLRALEN